MESRLQRKIRSHPYRSAEWIQREFFPKLSVARIEEEQKRAYETWKPISYTEGAVNDEEVDGVNDRGLNGEHTQLEQATLFVGPVDGYEGGPVSEWSRRASRSAHHRDWRADALWSNLERRALDRLRDMGRLIFVAWLGARKPTCPPVPMSRRQHLIWTVTGRLPPEPPAPFESRVTIYYRGTPLAAAKLITVVQAKGVRHSAPWVGDVTIPRSTLSHGLEGPPLRMPIGQEPVASASYWNNCGLGKHRKTLNLQPMTAEERIDERRQWCDLAAITQPSKQRRKDEPHD